MKPLLMIALAVALPASAFAEPGPCARWAGPLARPPTSAERAVLRSFVHDVARSEGVDPHALEAIAMVETRFVAALGDHCELGYFQIMPQWAPVFGLDSPRWFLDPRIGAIAAARLYRHGWLRWQPRYAQLSSNACFSSQGRRKKPLDRLVFAALVYNFGRAPQLLAAAPDLRRAKLPRSSCEYARRFEAELHRARSR